MLPLIAAGVGVAGGIGKMFARGRANRDLRSLMQRDPKYVANPIAAQRLALAQTLMNARMPGAMQAEKNIYQSAANTTGMAQRNATDASQLLALGAAAQGQADQSFIDLGQAEAQDYQRRFQNLTAAQQGQIEEGDKVFQDEARRYGNEVQMQGQINQNRQNTWQEISNMGFGLADFGLSGGFDSLKNSFSGTNKAFSNLPTANPAQMINQQGLNQALQNLPRAATGLTQQQNAIPYFLAPRNFRNPTDNFMNRWNNWLNP